MTPGPLPMEDMVRSISRTRLLGSLRRPSLAGDGLPERMRTTAFVFLGLTAAAGLALVAIFAQVGLPVLSPSPAPSGPLRAGSVSRAVALDRDRGVPAPGLAGGGIVPSGVRGDARAGGKGAPGDHRVGAVGVALGGGHAAGEWRWSGWRIDRSTDLGADSLRSSRAEWRCNHDHCSDSGAGPRGGCSSGAKGEAGEDDRQDQAREAEVEAVQVREQGSEGRSEGPERRFEG